MFFYMFLEKTKLKDDGSNDADWVRDLRCILIATQKNYVLEAPLGAKPTAGATSDVMNVCVTPSIQSYTNHTRTCVRTRSMTHGKISQHNSRHKLK